jgi:hypothetical protein
MRRTGTHDRHTIIYGSIGVHLRDEANTSSETAIKEATGVVRFLAPLLRHGHLIWRDVSAQHFHFPGGHFDFQSMGDYNRWRPNATCAVHRLQSMREYQTYITSRLALFSPRQATECAPSP